MKSLILFALLTMLSQGVMADAKKAFVEYLVGNVDRLDEVFRQVGLEGDAAKEAKESLQYSLAALNKGKGYPKSKSEIESIFASSPDLKLILSRDPKSVTAEDIGKIINKAARDSEKLTGNGSLMCSRCVDLKLSKIGVETVAVKSTSIVKKIIGQMPKDQTSVVRDVKRLAKSIGVKGSDFDRLVAVDASDSKNLWIALKVISVEGNSDSQTVKDFSSAFRAFSTLSNGETAYSGSKLWMIAAEAEGDDLRNFTKLFNRLSNESASSAEERVQSFAKYFEDQAASNDSLKVSLQKLKEKNCWKVF